MYDLCPIKNGQEAPHAKVINKDGKEVELKNYIGDRTVVMVFIEERGVHIAQGNYRL